MALPEIPKGVRKSLELPLSWEPLARMQAATDYYMNQAESAVTWHHPHWRDVAPHLLDNPDLSLDEVIGTFESDSLGITPGERWYEHPAGFGGASYPIEAVAALVGLTPEEYHEFIDRTRPHLSDHVLLRSGNYLVSAGTLESSKASEVFVGDVTRLSKVGIAVLESTLSAYAAGKNDSLG